MSFFVFLLLFLGAVFSPEQAYALSAPPRPVVISKYVGGIFTHVEQHLSTAPAGTAITCDPVTQEADEARLLRDLLVDTDAAIIQPEQELAHTACFTHDAKELERYLRSLIDSTLAAAKACNPDDASHYRTMAQYVWRMLWRLRSSGLDPRAKAPLTEMEVGDEPPAGALPTADDELCPYDSRYAPTQFLNVGCQFSLLPSTASSRLSREAKLMDEILQRIESTTGIASQLQQFRKFLSDLWNDAAIFVTGVSVLRPPAPLSISGLTFALATQPNVGESGCLGWPSDVLPGGTVSAERIPLQNYFPAVLTPDLAEAIAYLLERQDPRWLEYIQDLNQRSLDAGEEPGRRQLDAGELAIVNRLHLGMESFSILSIRDPQKRMEKLADLLHGRTRDFTQFAVALPNEPTPSDGPTLRSFIRQYAGFLSRMCVNRGCGNTLLRTIELSLRDECFSSFLMDMFFRNNPTARTLPACKALYVE